MRDMITSLKQLVGLKSDRERWKARCTDLEQKVGFLARKINRLERENELNQSYIGFQHDCNEILCSSLVDSRNQCAQVESIRKRYYDFHSYAAKELTRKQARIKKQYQSPKV